LKIIAKNWSLFESQFVTCLGSKRGKDKSLSFMDKLNEIRRLVGHPLKVHVSGYEFSAEETSFLADVDSLALKRRAAI
jgi:hypothetical protein